MTTVKTQSTTKGGRNMPTEQLPTEEMILRELKQREKRKTYMNSPKAKEGRKKYMKKRYEQTKAVKVAIEDLKAKDPAAYEKLLKLAQK